VRRWSIVIAAAVAVLSGLLFALASTDGGEAARPIYLDRSYSFAERAADLVARMTPQERASQLTSSQAPAIERLGVAAYGWWNEALHGVSRESTGFVGNPDIRQQEFFEISGSIVPRPSVLSAKPRIAKTDLERGVSQRVMFPEGVVVDPGLTLAMNDDTLYGFIEPGQSKPFPAGVTFSYSSNRPDVVSVDREGVIRTERNGVATITAVATDHGVSASTSFVVRVLSELDGLEVGGKAIEGFDPDVHDYDVTLPPQGTTTPPQVTATALTGSVEVTQAKGVPGTATVTCSGPDGIVSSYRVNFAQPPASDEFEGPALAPQWSFVRESPGDWSLTAKPGSLVITPTHGDLEKVTNSARNLLLQPALGDWTISSKLSFSERPRVATQQAGIIAYGDDDNYLKLALEATSPANIELSTTLEDDLSGIPIVQALEALNMSAILPGDNTIWLRMTKRGPSYSTSYSLDGVKWEPVWSTGATLGKLEVGLFAFNGSATTTSLRVAFDFFRVSS
jgi:beta-glucosidase